MRVSGPGALTIAQKMTHHLSFSPRNATLKVLHDANEQPLDEAIVIYFKAPYSFTGEDIVEFQCHGGTIVASMVLERILELGARLAKPGEFTKRALLNGKMDMTKAEAIASLINAKSEDAARLLGRQLMGSLKTYVETIRTELVEILAYIEVTIDYAEEDLPKDLLSRIDAKLRKIENELNRTLEASRSREGLIEGFRIAIVGKPNVGKSSLLNALLHYNRAITSEIAGTTRDTIEESLKIGTHLVRIIDTAGIRESEETIEKIGIQRAIASVENADIVIALFDRSLPMDSDDRKIVDLLEKYKERKRIFVLLNKKDLPPRFEADRLSAYEPITISVREDTSVLIRKLREYLDGQSRTDDMILINKRQIHQVTKANEAIKRARKLLENGEFELFAYELNDAIEAMAMITTPFEREEILDRMFGSFCLGK